MARELAAIYRDFLPGDLQPLLDEGGIDGTVLVQAAPTEAEPTEQPPPSERSPDAAPG